MDIEKLSDEKIQNEIQEQQEKLLEFLKENQAPDIINIMAMQNLIVAILNANADIDTEMSLKLLDSLRSYCSIVIAGMEEKEDVKG